ncbi:gonadotropin-releasing hormone receptor [Diachasma alloeum]|uniref:gonadotropin-releasing hormone receptor n=1 Tax=Diachasma alloeum TaxID=454923 RepID=UPI0007385029|nr:gonadotropin-releasing hormone receptor [Diachasma alloeum]
MSSTHADLLNLSSDAALRLGCDNTTESMNESIANADCLDHAPTLTTHAYVKAIVLGVMGVFSLIANSATIWSITRNRRKHQGCSAVYTLILHLSVADLFVSVFCLIGDAVWSYSVDWPWGNATCKLFKFLQMFSLYLSTFVLVLIGVDRFIAVRYPMKSLNTAQRCNRLVVFTWILSFVLSIPQLVIFHVSRGPFIEEFTQCVTHGFYTEPWQEQLYTTLSLIFMFILPLAILISTYVSTVITIARSEKAFKTGLVNNNTINQLTGDVNRRRLMHRAKSKSLRISIVIVAAFVIWWMPYYSMMVIFIFLNPDEHLSEDLQNGIFFFGMSNSLVNPLIYGAFHLWPKRRRPGSRHRDGSTMQHHSTTTHASFMAATRGGSTRVTRSNPPRWVETNMQGNSHAADQAVLLNHADGSGSGDEKNGSQTAKLILQYNVDNHEFRKKVIDGR